ncbi:MAG: rod shape-determining protein MreC, partial [Bacteroides sp.]
WFLFFFLEIGCFVLLFRFNSYQGSVYFTSANQVVGKIYEVSGGITSYFHLKSVNNDLVDKTIKLEQQVEMLQKAFLKVLKDSAAVPDLKDSVLSDYIVLKANVIDNSLNKSNNYITLNKGSKDGIRPDMGVLNGNGIVGIVYMTSPHYSVVISLLNSKSNISCKIKKSKYFGYLKWEGGDSEFAYLKDLPRHARLALGDTVVTSGFSAVFPSDIMVGTINKLSDSHDGLSYLLKVKLSADFGQLDDVRVISKNNRSELQELERRAKK